MTDHTIELDTTDDVLPAERDHPACGAVSPAVAACCTAPAGHRRPWHVAFARTPTPHAVLWSTPDPPPIGG